MMQPLLAEEMIIPVMDGLDEKSVRHFSGAIHQMDSFRSIGLEGSLSIRYTHNVLGEVFYADSRYSALFQVTDVIAYMRNASDLFDLGKPITEFKTHLLEASRSIDECFVREHVVSMVVDGKVQGPVEYVIPIQTSSGPLSRMVTVVPSDSESIPRPPRIQWPEGPHPDIEF